MRDMITQMTWHAEVEVRYPEVFYELASYDDQVCVGYVKLSEDTNDRMCVGIYDSRFPYAFVVATQMDIDAGVVEYLVEWPDE